MTATGHSCAHGVDTYYVDVLAPIVERFLARQT
jgi:hypothetical protein